MQQFLHYLGGGDEHCAFSARAGEERACLCFQRMRFATPYMNTLVSTKITYLANLMI